MTYEQKQQSSSDHIDLKNKYIQDIYEVYQYSTIYFTRYIAHPSYPGKLQLLGLNSSSMPGTCYIYVFKGPAQIYAHPFQIYCQLLNLNAQSELTKPSQQTVQFLVKLYKLYQEIEGSGKSQNIIHRLLSSFSFNKQFISNHIKAYGKTQNSHNYQKQNIQAWKQYSQRHLKNGLAYDDFLEERQKLIQIIPTLYDEDRLQPVIKSARQLMSMYGMEVLGNKDWHKGKKILIKCDAVQLREYSDDFYSCFQLTRPPPYEENSTYMNLKLTEIVKQFKKIFRLVKSQSQILEDIQQYNRLKIKLLKQVTQQLFEYQFLTNSQYPNLHPDYISLNTKSYHFTLAPVPIFLQALGFHKNQEQGIEFHDQCYYDKNFYADIGWTCSFKQPVSNVWKFIMIMHYFQMGTFQKSPDLTQKSLSPKQWLKLLFGMSPKQIELQLNQFKKQMGLIGDNKKNYSSFLLFKQSFTKTILLLFLSFPNIKPSLANLCQLFSLDQSISTLSPSRHEHLLQLRFKSANLMLTLHRNLLTDINKWYQDTNPEHQILDSQNRTYLCIIEVVVFLTGMELREVLRKGDQLIWKETEDILDNISNNVDQIIDKFTKMSSISNLYEYLALVTRKLNYIYNKSKKGDQARLPVTILYSKILKNILSKIQSQVKNNKNIKLYEKYYQKKGGNNFLYIRPITYIVISLILKMESTNLHWCQYFIYRKIKQLIEEDQISQSDINSLQHQLDNKVCSEEHEWLVWGNLWPEDDPDDIYS